MAPHHSHLPTRPQVERLATQGVIVLLVANLFLQYLPGGFGTMMRGDSSIFLYIGQQLLNGLQLYTDLWDHKPPLIFWINAAGLWIGGGSPLGVVILGYLAVTSFFLVCYNTAARYAGLLPSFLATLLVLNVVPLLLPHPNFTEVFALPFQAFSLSLGLRELNGRRDRWSPLAQGMLAGVLFFLRPNAIGVSITYLTVFVAIDLFVDRRGFRHLLSRVLLFTMGLVTVGAVIGAPFLWRGTYGELSYATLQFNFEYSGLATMGDRMKSLIRGFVLLSESGVAPLALAGLAVGWLLHLRQRAAPPWFLFVTVLTICECALSVVSGRGQSGGYEHYFLLWLCPFLFLLAFFWASMIVQAEGTAENKRTDQVRRLLLWGLSVMLVLTCAGRGLRAARTSLYAERIPDPIILEQVYRIQESPDVYVWGGNGPPTALLFKLGVKPVSKYFHVTPFSHSREGYLQAVGEIMTNLESRRPKIIIEYRAGTLPGLFQEAECPDSDLKFQDSWDTPEIKERKRGLSKEYREGFAEAGGGAAVYVRN